MSFTCRLITIMELTIRAYFDQLRRVRYEGPQSTNRWHFVINPDELVFG